MRIIMALALAGATSAAQAAPIPDPVAAMIDAAAGDPAQLKTVTDIAKKTNPGSVAEIDAKLAAINGKAAADKEAKLASQGILDGWSGSGEIGAFVTTGNTKDTGIAVGVGVKKETRQWRHAVSAIVDYQKSNSVTTKERYFVGYDGAYKFSTRFFAVGQLSWEKDSFAGYSSRFTESIGLGYRLVNAPRFTIDLEGGPAARQTDYILAASESTIGGRAAAKLLWTISPDTSFSEVATGYFDSVTNTLESTTALTTKLTGALSARASFNVRHETNPPAGRENTDSTSRFTLVYAF